MMRKTVLTLLLLVACDWQPPPPYQPVVTYYDGTYNYGQALLKTVDTGGVNWSGMIFFSGSDCLGTHHWTGVETGGIVEGWLDNAPIGGPAAFWLDLETLDAVVELLEEEEWLGIDPNETACADTIIWFAND